MIGSGDWVHRWNDRFGRRWALDRRSGSGSRRGRTKHGRTDLRGRGRMSGSRRGGFFALDLWLNVWDPNRFVLDLDTCKELVDGRKTKSVYVSVMVVQPRHGHMT
jgi:hypothetical protein